MTPPKRSVAEWVTFAVASAMLLVVVGYIAAQIPTTAAPAAPAATVSKIGERDGRFFVTVEVENRGGRTAENVQVVATLVIGEDETEGDQVVDFLAGSEMEEVEFVFDDDPATGELTVSVTGYLVP